MIPADVRMAIFEALDQSDPSILGDAAAVRQCLYRVTEQLGQYVTESVEYYIELLIEEFCPDSVAGKP